MRNKGYPVIPAGVTGPSLIERGMVLNLTEQRFVEFRSYSSNPIAQGDPPEQTRRFRKLKIFEVSGHIVTNLLCTGRKIMPCLVREGVPEGARILQASYDNGSEVLSMLVESDAFEEVSEGCEVPRAGFTLELKVTPRSDSSEE